jgi:hypothetical protein
MDYIHASIFIGRAGARGNVRCLELSVSLPTGKIIVLYVVVSSLETQINHKYTTKASGPIPFAGLLPAPM